MSDEALLNSINTSLLLISAIILFILSYNLFKRKEREYYETTFGLGLFIGGISSLQCGFFRAFYIFYTEGPMVETWKLSSYFYYSLMSITLTLLFCGGLAIMRGKREYKLGFILLILVIPISIGYWFVEDAITITAGLADTQMDINGVILVFGTLGLQILIVAFVYFYMYNMTKNKGALNMFLGMIILLLSAGIGGLTDYFGDIGRIFDSLGYLGVLFGLLLIVNGFRGSES